MGLLELLVEAGAATSNGEARRLVEQGGVAVNNSPATDSAARLTRSELLGGSSLVIRVGKKRHYLARFEGQVKG